MLANNNKKIIARMAKRSLTSNKRKNGIMIITIMLSTFMLFSILTVGATFLKMQRQQEIRMKGADFAAYIYGGFTEEQKEICEKNSEVDIVGVEGMAGWAVETEEDDTLHSIFCWADDKMWNVLKTPAMERVEGHYPEKDNEIMATKDALRDCGYEDLDVGDSFAITYQDNHGVHTKEFIISGMWEGYGDTKVFYVSRSFFDQSGFTLEDPGRGFLYIHYRSYVVSDKTQGVLEESLKLGKKQRFLTTFDTAQSVQIIAGLVGLVGITCLSAYLLIYNILYLSVSGNIRYYGLLQTVGMTGRQVGQLMKRQMLLVGAIGIGSGMLLGIGTSFFLIPMVVKSLGIRIGSIPVVFHPVIFILSILVSVVTIWLGGRKPVKIATDISPIEALGYRSISRKKNSRKVRKGSILWRMAREQLSKDKKKTGIVVLSLAASLSVFLCLITLIESQGPRTIVSNYMDTDIEIQNDTLYKENPDDWVQLMDEEFRDTLKKNERIQEIHYLLTQRIVVPWEPEVAEPWMRELYEVWYDDLSYDEDVKEDYMAHPEKYYSYIMGIDEREFDYLNSTLETPVDKSDFLAGRCGILCKNGLGFDMNMLKGKYLDCYLPGRPDEAHEFAITGLTDDMYYNNMPGCTPNIIVSSEFLRSIVDDPYVFKVNIRYAQEYDETAEQEIKDMMNESPYVKSFSYDSKIDAMKMVKDAQGNMMGVGIGIGLILALIGIMNYINTVSGNIQSREMELAVMESVGMTEKQVKKMLVREGLLFGISSLALSATAGLGVTYVVYQSMNYRDIAFEVPAIPVGIIATLVMAVCVVVPLAAYRILAGERTIVERIRIGDGSL